MEMQKHLSVTEWCTRNVQLREAYCPWLRERHPRGTVVMINLLTAEYLVGRDATKLMTEFAAKFGDADWCLDMVHPVTLRRDVRE
jgi:hypothetical protein